MRVMPPATAPTPNLTVSSIHDGEERERERR